MVSQTVLVTGGFGYVGSVLTPSLLNQGYRVKVLDLCLYGDDGLHTLEDALKKEPGFNSDWKNRFEHIRGDLRDPNAVSRALENVNSVIHLGAISNDPTGEVDDVLTRQVNFDAVGMLLSTAKKKGITRFINASSSSVFGIKDQENVTEVLEPEPITHYSKNKMLSEWLVNTASSPEFCTVNIRPATICGVSPRQRFDLTVNKLTADAVRKRVITVHGGEQRRPNVGMTDVVNLYSRLLNTEAKLINGRTFNFGFENLKVIEIAQLIQKELKDLDVRIDITPTQDNRDYHISSEKILKTLSYQPVSSIRQEVKNLRTALESGSFPDIDHPRHYNMKSMNIGRNDGCYQFLASC